MIRMLLKLSAVALLVLLISASLDFPSKANSQTTYGYTCVSYIPAVLTAEEQGVIQGVRVSWWAGLSMPAATPDHVARQWEVALAQMVNDHRFRMATDRLWMKLAYLNPEEMTIFVEEQAIWYTAVAEKMGIRE